MPYGIIFCIMHWILFVFYFWFANTFAKIYIFATIGSDFGSKFGGQFNLLKDFSEVNAHFLQVVFLRWLCICKIWQIKFIPYDVMVVTRERSREKHLFGECYRELIWGLFIYFLNKSFAIRINIVHSYVDGTTLVLFRSLYWVFAKYIGFVPKVKNVLSIFFLGRDIIVEITVIEVLVLNESNVFVYFLVFTFVSFISIFQRRQDLRSNLEV